MKRVVVVAVFGLLFASDAGSGRASAQVPAGPRLTGSTAPPFSPYLNLLRQGGSTTLNYYGLVRPEIQTRNAVMGLQQQVNANQNLLVGMAGQNNDPSGNAGLPDTGHAAVFLNTGSYFLTLTPNGAGRPQPSQLGQSSRPSSSGRQSSSSPYSSRGR